MSLERAGTLPHCPRCLSHETGASIASERTHQLSCFECGNHSLVRRQEIRGVIHQEDCGLSFECIWAVGEIDT